MSNGVVVYICQEQMESDDLDDILQIYESRRRQHTVSHAARHRHTPVRRQVSDTTNLAPLH